MSQSNLGVTWKESAMPTVRKPKPPWKDREHLFTAEFITRYEFLTCPRKLHYPKCRFRHRTIKHGTVIWIIKDGKPVTFNKED